ncbi:predicted GPI-anchored protein 58 [Andrographis paniculata]|uniref:predicted GPI-anchored protein 58 n=1 Tax=Andrographis paniculata TaxID=175694 RepID=UPI0021E8D981|nr:predicted GPI-anchored protein 58 [Andrographis paniculata]
MQAVLTSGADQQAAEDYLMAWMPIKIRPHLDPTPAAPTDQPASTPANQPNLQTYQPQVPPVQVQPTTPALPMISRAEDPTRRQSLPSLPTPSPTEPEAAVASTDIEAAAQPMAVLPTEIADSSYSLEELAAPAAAIPPPEAAAHAAESLAAIRPGGLPLDIEELSSSESEASVNNNLTEV